MAVHDVLVLVVTLLTGLMGMGITQWVKEKLGVENKGALVLAGVVAGVLAFGELLLTGELNLTELTLGNWTDAFAMVFAAATVFYKLLLADKNGASG